MSEPLVSIVVTVRDCDRFLAEALDSALAQTHRPLEVIVVDDGSQDRSAEIAEGYGPPIEVIRRPARGVSAARNVALDRYQGEFLAFLDADDRMRPESVRRSLAAFDERPELDAVFHSLVEFVSPDVDSAMFQYRDVGTHRPARLPSNCLVRRGVVRSVGRYDESLTRAQGLEWITRLIDLPARTVMLEDILSERRLHESNHGFTEPEAILDYLTVVRRQLRRRRADGRH